MREWKRKKHEFEQYEKASKYWEWQKNALLDENESNDEDDFDSLLNNSNTEIVLEKNL